MMETHQIFMWTHWTAPAGGDQEVVLTFGHNKLYSFYSSNIIPELGRAERDYWFLIGYYFTSLLHWACRPHLHKVE